MCLQCYQSDDSRHSHQQTNEFQILFQPWCHLYTRKITVGREQCPAAHQIKQVPIEILLRWLQHFVAYCTEMNLSILKFSTYAISMEFAFQKFMRRSVKGLLEVQYNSDTNNIYLLYPKFLPSHLLLWSTEFHSYDSSWKHVACPTEACVHQDEP